MISNAAAVGVVMALLVTPAAAATDDAFDLACKSMDTDAVWQQPNKLDFSINLKTSTYCELWDCKKPLALSSVSDEQIVIYRHFGMGGIDMRYASSTAATFDRSSGILRIGLTQGDIGTHVLSYKCAIRPYSGRLESSTR